MTHSRYALYLAPEPGGDFTILRRFPLGGPKPARRHSSRVGVETFVD